MTNKPTMKISYDNAVKATGTPAAVPTLQSEGHPLSEAAIQASKNRVASQIQALPTCFAPMQFRR